jgi:hypothetical protein
MIKTRLKEIASALRLFPPGPSGSPQGRNPGRFTTIPPPQAPGLGPYSAKDLKYLWSLWDEAQGRHQPARRYRLIYVGAVGVILAGWLIHRMGPSGSTPYGGILMLAGAVLGAWYCLKSLCHRRHSALRR